MFKTAPRYLSGVSVFYGDDITRRNTTGEVVIFVGPSTKGPRAPIALNSVDNSISLYGTNNPLTKAIYQFWDGYQDSQSTNQLQLVTLRIGGVPAKITTYYGLTLETADAYDGIENDFYIFVNNTDEKNKVVKVWDTNRQIVYDSVKGVDTQSVIVSKLPIGDGGVGAFYGKDLDNDPLATPVTIGEIVYWDLVNPITGGTAIHPASNPTDLSTSIQINLSDVTQIPATGTLAVKAKHGALTYLVYADYTAFDVSTKTFKLSGAFGSDLTGIPLTDIFINFVGTTIVKGDSNLNLSKRELYGLMRNALLDVEQFTPDYIVPAGVAYNDTEKFNRTYASNSAVADDVTAGQHYVIIDAAATWPTSGTIAIFDGTNTDEAKYTAITVVNPGVDPSYRLQILCPDYVLAQDAKANDKSIVLFQSGTGYGLNELMSSGYIQVGTDILHYTIDTTVSGKLNFTGTGALAADVASGEVATKVLGAATSLITLVGTTWFVQEDFELGIGYVQETDTGDGYTFQWSDTKKANYNLAHFGYLFANYCNEAAVGYSTPLCGMNVTLPSSYDRSTITSWIGKNPEVKIIAGTTDAVEGISKNGTGLLGDPTLTGSIDHNRCYMTNKANSSFADPAYGLLLTEEGFVDGHEIRDTYQKVVDLGKFMCVGAGVLTFNNRAANVAYNDTCGVYALGYLSGVAKNEGIAFKQIGVNSSTSVGVVVHRKLYNDLAGAGYIVVTREKGLGWVINNDNSVARNQSGFYLISTTRTVKTVIESKRALLVGFIGKPVNRFYFEAAKTKLAASFKDDVDQGYLNGYQFDLQIVDANRAIGKLYLKCVVNPPLELVQVDIDTVIDRNVTTTA